MDSFLVWLFVSPKWQLLFVLNPGSLRNSAPNPNSSKIPLGFPWIRRVGREGGEVWDLFLCLWTKGFPWKKKKNIWDVLDWGKRLRDTWNSLGLEYGVGNRDGSPTGSVNSLPAPQFHPEIPKKPQPTPNYPMGWNSLPEFPAISPQTRERGAPSWMESIVTFSSGIMCCLLYFFFWMTMLP